MGKILISIPQHKIVETKNFCKHEEQFYQAERDHKKMSEVEPGSRTEILEKFAMGGEGTEANYNCDPQSALTVHL